MSNQITTAMVKQFGSNVELVYQQTEARLRAGVRVETVKGEVEFFEQIGTTSAVKSTSRYAPMPLVNTPHMRRMVAVEDYTWADLVDPLDLKKTLIDPTSPYVINAGRAFARLTDEVIISAFFADAYTGKNGTTSVSFPTATNQVSAASAGLTLSKLISAKEILDNNDVPPENRHIAITGTQLADLLGTTEVTSADYNTIKALVKGEVDSFLGFKFHLVNLLETDGSGNRRVPVWHGDAMLLGVGQDAKASIDKRTDLDRLPMQVSYIMSLGATRMQEEGVVEIQCVES